MPIYSVQGPDGRIYDVEGPAGASETDIVAFVQQQIAAGTLKPAGKEGVFAALGKGAESTLSQLRTGVSGIFGTPEEAAVAGIERGKKIEGEYADQVSADRIIKAFKEKGILPGIGETVRQIPYAVAEQAPNIATMATGARLGAMAGAPLGPVGALVGGGLGALSASALQQFGGNIERQAQEQQRQGVPVQIDTGAAGAAALGQGALDVAATAIPLGGRLVSKMTGIPMERLLGRTPEQVRKLADERLLTTVSKGLATGALAEIPTEITQQILERAQAGLSLTDEDAMREYGHTAIEVGLLAPFGGMGRLAERGGARQQIAQEQARAKAAAQRAQLEQEEQDRQQKVAAEEAAAARRQTPEYAQEKAAAWEAMQQQVQDLQTRAQAKVPQNDAVAQADKAEAKQLLQTLRRSDEYKTALQEFRAVRPILQQLQAQAQAQAAPAITPELQQADATQQAWEAFQERAQKAQAEQAAQAARMEQERFAGPAMQLDMVGPVPPVAQTPQQYQSPTGVPLTPSSQELAPQAPNRATEFAQKQQELAQLLEAHQQEESAAAAKLDLPGLDQLAKRRTLLQNEYDYVTKQLEALGGIQSADVLQRKLDKAKSDLQKLAGEGYDPAKADKLRATITSLTNQIQELGGAPGQMALDLGRATRAQAIPTIAEWNAALVKKRLGERAPVGAIAEGEEQDYLAQQEAERRAATAEAARVAKVSPELAALQRIAAKRPVYAGEEERQLPKRAETAIEAAAAKPGPQYPSAAIGQMQQLLTGQDVTYTAETAPAKGVQRAPGEGFRLYARQTAPERPNRPAEIQQRLARVLARSDLSEDAYNTLRRAEQVLPAEAAEADADFLNLLDQQLERIEQGKEGVAQKGAGRTITLQQMPPQRPIRASTAEATQANKDDINKARWRANRYQENLAKGMSPADAAQDAYRYSEAALADQKAAALTRTESALPNAAVTKRRQDIEATTIRGPSTAAPALSMQEALEPEIAKRERVVQKTTGQQELFPEEAQGDLFAEPAEKRVEAAAKEDTDIIARYNTELPELDARIKRLQNIVNKIGAMENAAQADADLVTARKDLADLQKIADSLPLIGPRSITHVPSREAAYREFDISQRLDAIETERKEREAVINSSKSMSPAEKAQLNALVNGIPEEMGVLQAHRQQLTSFIAAANAQLKVAEAQRRIEDASARLKQPGLFPNEQAAQLGAVRRQAQADLVPLRAQVRALTAAYQDALRQRKEAERRAKAVNRAARERELLAKYTAEQARLEQMQALPTLTARREIFGPQLQQIQYPAITIAEREARQNKLDPEKFKLTEGLKLKGSPERIARGYASDVTNIQRRIQQRYEAGLEAVFQYMDNYDQYQKLREQYDTAKTKEAKGNIESQLRPLEKQLRAAAVAAKLPGNKEYQNLLKQYAAAKTADARAALAPQLRQAEIELRFEAANLAQKEKTWPGKAKDIADLTEAIRKRDAFEQLRTEGYFEEPRAPKVKVSAAQKESEAAAQRSEYAAEAATRADAPTTSGETLTKGQIDKARKAKPTRYSSKGVSIAEGATAAEQEILFEAQRREAAGEELTPLQAFMLAEYKKSRKEKKVEAAAEETPNTETEDTARAKTAKELADELREETGVFSEGTKDVQDLFDDPSKYQKSVESPTIDLAPEAIEALKNNDLLGALNSVQQSSKIEINRVMARRLMMFLRDTQVVVRDDLKNDRGELVYGAATESGDFIYINGKIGFNEETLLHEAVHAATERIVQMDESKLTAQQLAAKRELQALYEAIKADKDITSENAKESLSEFIAEAMSNNLLQRQMSQKKWTFKNAWESFKKVVLTALGIRVPSTMLDAALVATDTLFAQPLVSVKAGAPLVYRKPSYANPGLAAAGEVADKFIQKDRNAFETVRAAAGGFLGLETQLVDRFAGFERLRKLMPELKGSQMMYYLRFYDQRMNLVAQSAGNGALKRVEYTRPDGQKEFIIESQQGASLRGVAETLKEAKDIAGSADAASRLFTLYLSAIRAKDKGFDALHLGEELTEADLNAAMREIQRTPGLEEIFQRARNEYNEYNRGLVGFAVDCGAIPKNRAAELLKENDYIPWYRERNGVAEMVIGKETPIRIGSIAEQPYLHELVGSGKPILDFMVSSVQNTNMLTDMALRNLATKNAVFELVELKLAKITRRPMAGPNVVRFRVQPEEKDDSGERYAMIDTDAAGVPADILVKGMEGIPTQMPFVVRALAMPATLLRRAITLTPLYQARQLFRDSLAAPMLAGADFMPVLGALKEVGSVNKDILERRGVTGGQVFTGGQEDLSKILRDTTNDGLSWSQALSKLEAVAASTDALTRRAQYNSYVSQGLSQMEATLMSLESMNFNKRGASPSIHWLNAMVPFLNAQIQSMNVLYKAMTGKLPFNEKLRIQEKLYTRGMIVAGSTLAYAAAMQDDEAYKNATPDQKYGNWFVRVPGFDEPVRLPVPFEIGYIFKSVPEAIFNSLKNEHGTEEAFKALNQILINTIPGGSSMPTISIGQAKIPLGIPIPQALKTPTELALGKSFFTGRDILSAHEKMLAPEAQFRENTTELAKMFGARTGASPIVLEQLVQGYTGSIGLMFLQALSVGIAPGQSPEKAVKRWSDTPVIGGAFQPNDAGGIINATYDRMVDMQKISRTVDDYITRGELAKAKELIATKSNEYAMAEVADMYVSTMREFTQYETAIRASNLTPEKKREELTRIRQMKIKFSEMVRKAADKTKPQEALS